MNFKASEIGALTRCIAEIQMSLMSVKEVATDLSVSKKTVYLLVSQGKLGAHRVGAGRGTIRISQKHLDDYLSVSASETPLIGPSRPVKLQHLSFK